MGLILYKPSRQKVGEKTAQIEYETTFSFPDNTYKISYRGTIGGIAIRDTTSGSNISGTVDISGLTPGWEEEIQGNMYCKYYYTTSTWVPATETTPGHWDTKYHEGEKQSDVVAISIYTHPGSFDIGATKDTSSNKSIIANVLNSEIINDEWIPRFQAAYRWYNQKNISYSPANITYDYFSNNNNGGMKVKQNDPISAEWFNNCMEGMRQFGKEVDDVEKDELITANLINQMDFSGIN